MVHKLEVEHPCTSPHLNMSGKAGRFTDLENEAKAEDKCGLNYCYNNCNYIIKIIIYLKILMELHEHIRVHESLCASLQGSESGMNAVQVFFMIPKSQSRDKTGNMLLRSL